jgi:hypothetical protein
MEPLNQKTIRKTQEQMGGQHHTGPQPHEVQKLDNLHSGQSKMEGNPPEGQNFRQIKGVQRLKKKKMSTRMGHSLSGEANSNSVNKNSRHPVLRKVHYGVRKTPVRFPYCDPDLSSPIRFKAYLNMTLPSMFRSCNLVSFHRVIPPKVHAFLSSHMCNILRPVGQ